MQPVRERCVCERACLRVNMRDCSPTCGFSSKMINPLGNSFLIPRIRRTCSIPWLACGLWERCTASTTSCSRHERTCRHCSPLTRKRVVNTMAQTSRRQSPAKNERETNLHPWVWRLRRKRKTWNLLYIHRCIECCIHRMLYTLILFYFLLSFWWLITCFFLLLIKCIYFYMLSNQMYIHNVYT